MSHVDEGTLHAYLDGALEGAEKATVQQHLAGCHDCRVALEEARALIGQAAKILEGGRPAVEAVPPPLATQAPQRHRMIPLAWAASLIVALAAGWFAHTAITGTTTPTRLRDAEPTELAMREDAQEDTAGGVAGEQFGVPSAASDQDVAASTTVAGSPGEAAPPPVQKAAESPAPAAQDEPRLPTVAARLDSITRAERARAAEEATVERRVEPTLQAQRVARAPATVTALPPPRLDTLPGFAMVTSTLEGAVTTVRHVSASGDTVVLSYEPASAAGDTTRVFQDGLVLERDGAGRARLVAGVYRVIGAYRVTATGTVPRDSLMVLLSGLESRSP